MATGFPASTGDVLTSGMFNGLTSFTIGTANTTDYTAVSADQYQVLEIMDKATAIAFNIPTNASVPFPIGTALTVLNIGAGTCTIKAVTSGTTTVLSAGGTAAQPTLGQYKSAVCLKTATDTWYVVGSIA
jgi:hypothetical protein